MTIDTTKLRELAQKATPGPWTQWNGHGWVSAGIPESNTKGSMIGAGGQICETECDDFSDAQNRRNAAYIAAANPATVLQLLDEIDRLQVNEFFQPDQTLEHAKERIDALEQQLNEAAQCIANQSQTIARLLEIEKAARNLQKAKGRHNTEIAMNRLQATLAASE